MPHLILIPIFKKKECGSPCDESELMLGVASSWTPMHLARQTELRQIQGQVSVPSPTGTLSAHSHG